MFTTAIADGVLQARAVGARWLATGQGGGYRTAPAAYNVAVPEGFDRTDLDDYVTRRCERAGFDEPGPAMLTGVDLTHARGAEAGPVRVVATAGVSNPATLPVDDRSAGEQCDGGDGRTGADRDDDRAETDGSDGTRRSATDAADWRPGTVNLLVGSTRPLTDGGLATLLGTVVEAKTATLLATTGFSGTTSDAVVVGCHRQADEWDDGPTPFAGSATDVGDAARACVAAAVRASLDARYDAAEADVPGSVADAEHGVVTTRAVESFQP